MFAPNGSKSLGLQLLTSPGLGVLKFGFLGNILSFLNFYKSSLSLERFRREILRMPPLPPVLFHVIYSNLSTLSDSASQRHAKARPGRIESQSSADRNQHWVVVGF